MIAYVTGATGCIGNNLVRELLKDKLEVVVLHRKTSDLSRLDGCQVQFKEVNLWNFKSVLEAIPTGVDALFHVAANTSHYTSYWDKEGIQYKDNAWATTNLVKAALIKGVKRFIFTSTGATVPYVGQDVYKIPNNYIYTKRLAEIQVEDAHKRGLDTVILKPIIVIGAHDYNSYGQIFEHVKSGSKLVFPGRLDFCHAQDVARAHISAFHNGRSGEYYILNGEYNYWLYIFGEMARVMGVVPPLRATSQRKLYAIASMMELWANISGKRPLLTRELLFLVKDAPPISQFEIDKTIRDLGYASRSAKTAIRDCYEWMKTKTRG